MKTDWCTLRIPRSMFELLQEAAIPEHRSASAEALLRLERSFHGDTYHHTAQPLLTPKAKEKP